MRASRKGFAVAISRRDGSTFLACSSPGVLPAVFVQRKWAVKHRRELKLHGFKCRVVPVTFTEPMEARSKTRGTADAVGLKEDRIGLGLALLAIARKPGEVLTLQDIAAWCDCRPSTIYRLEQSALQKARWAPQNPAVRRAILAAMKPTKKAATPFEYKQQHGLIVVCKDEADQQRKFQQLTKRGLTVRVVTV